MCISSNSNSILIPLHVKSNSFRFNFKLIPFRFRSMFNYIEPWLRQSYRYNATLLYTESLPPTNCRVIVPIVLLGILPTNKLPIQCPPCYTRVPGHQQTTEALFPLFYVRGGILADGGQWEGLLAGGSFLILNNLFRF